MKLLLIFYILTFNFAVASFLWGIMYNDGFWRQTRKMYFLSFSSVFLGIFYIFLFFCYVLFLLIKESIYKIYVNTGLSLLYKDFIGKLPKHTIIENLPKVYSSEKRYLVKFAMKYLAKKYNIEIYEDKLRF